MLVEIKTRLHWVGAAVAGTGVLFVAVRLRNYSVHIEMSRLGPDMWIWLTGFSFIYGAGNILLALGWCDIMHHLKCKACKMWTVKVYGMTQLAKYIPGNVMHFAGRLAVGLSAGLPGKTLTQSMAWELGLLTLAGSILGVLALPLLYAKLSLPMCLFLFLFTTCSTGAMLWIRFSYLVTRAFTCFICFLGLSGLLFDGLLYVVQTPALAHTFPWLTLCGAYAIAWLIGFLTPGAPAGVGIREIVLLFLLKTVVQESDLLLAVMLGRVVTVVGDTLFFATTFIFSKNMNVGDGNIGEQ